MFVFWFSFGGAEKIELLKFPAAQGGSRGVLEQYSFGTTTVVQAQKIVLLKLLAGGVP